MRSEVRIRQCHRHLGTPDDRCTEYPDPGTDSERAAGAAVRVLERSRTLQGIADAMADQWGGLA